MNYLHLKKIEKKNRFFYRIHKMPISYTFICKIYTKSLLELSEFIYLLKSTMKRGVSFSYFSYFISATKK